MAITLTAKPSGAVYRYTWAVPVIDGDSVASVTLTPTGCTVDSYEIDGNSVIFYVSGGTDGQIATIAAEADTDQAETLIETLYVPIRASTNALANTARDLVHYALRKVTGIADVPDADQLTDGLEALSDMLAGWRLQGADVGIPVPVGENDAILCDDGYIPAIKANLILTLSHLYGFEVSPVVAMQARVGLQTIKAGTLPSERYQAEYY